MALKPENMLEVAPEVDRLIDETSVEPFDRLAFAARALDLVRPLDTTVALCAGAARMRVEAGRVWGGKPSARWAMLAIPATASRRAIALAVAELAGAPPAYAYDVLLAAPGAGGREYDA